MNPEEALGIVIDKLNEQRIPYMIVGSFASNLHGVPRTTHDADGCSQYRQSSIKFGLGIPEKIIKRIRCG
jgi:hypothetical protein